MTNQDILKVALAQSAVDMSCAPEDFLKEEPTVVISRPQENARRYLKLPFILDITSYGHGAVASTQPEYADFVGDYLRKYPTEHLFETPNLHVLNDYFEEQGFRVCFMAEYFLPDVDALKPLDCPYSLKFLEKGEFSDLYVPAWSNALSFSRPEDDVLAIGAYDGEMLIGLAGCSRDAEEMWQIGIDVLPAYRHHGVASALTSRLALEIIRRGKVPFYCAAWSNIPSVRNAIRSGFRPAWAEITVKSREMVDGMNQ